MCIDQFYFVLNILHKLKIVEIRTMKNLFYLNKIE